MKWMVVIVFVLQTSCLTAGVHKTEYALPERVSLDLSTCSGKCDQERDECMIRMSQFWEQCEGNYDSCVEYCY